MKNKKQLYNNSDSINENHNKKQLVLFVDNTTLPTNKNHISYSELYNWIECSFRHKLKHIDKIDLDQPNIHLHFGKVLHDALEKYLLTKELPDIEQCVVDFEKAIGDLFFTEKAVELEEAKEFVSSIKPILEQVPEYLDEHFPGWKIVAAEEKLFEPIDDCNNKYFKGFIDLIIKVPKIKKGKKTRLSGIKGEVVKGEWDYYLLDWKTTNTGWRSDYQKAFSKHLQLILYKHFFCRKANIKPEKVKCGFIFLRRSPRKDGRRIDYLPVKSDKSSTDKAILLLRSAINQINSKRYVKNKFSCMFCEFANTKHCP